MVRLAALLSARILETWRRGNTICLVYEYLAVHCMVPNGTASCRDIARAKAKLCSLRLSRFIAAVNSCMLRDMARETTVGFSPALRLWFCDNMDTWKTRRNSKTDCSKNRKKFITQYCEICIITRTAESLRAYSIESIFVIAVSICEMSRIWTDQTFEDNVTISLISILRRLLIY